MNLQEINLDENLVIPLPKEFTKEQLAIISANYSGYQQKIDEYSNRTFTGTQEDFEKELGDRVLGLNAWIIEIEKKENDILNITYQILDKIDNPISIIDFGIAKAIVPLGNYIREAIQSLQIKEEELALEQKKQAVQEQLSVLDNIKAT